MNLVIREFALANRIIICVVIACRFGTLAFGKRQLEGYPKPKKEDFRWNRS
ncbi:MAG: hypothetical protein H6Q48_3788 [Deltaproteobacteria bacterium]|nr:hypothetical protein [Deltaproteobacteria bacterium]